MEVIGYFVLLVLFYFYFYFMGLNGYICLEMHLMVSNNILFSITLATLYSFALFLVILSL